MNVKIKWSILIVIILVLSGFSTVNAGPEDVKLIRGYVLVDGVETQADEIILTVAGSEYISDRTWDDGFYEIMDEIVTGTGTFEVKISGYGVFKAEETILIKSTKDDYTLNLHINSSEPLNDAPLAPSNPNPADKQTGVSTSPTLSVEVSDPDGDNMKVTFYDASDDTTIGVDNGVPSGSTASVSWSGLSYTTTYSWYAISNDGSLDSNSSDTWEFTTKASGGGGGGDDDDDDNLPSPGPGPGPGDNLPPIAVATVDVTTGPPGLVCNFDASGSSDPEETDLNYTWNFDDGNTGYGLTIAHTFTSVGVYEVMLTVEDEGGATDNLNEPIIIEVVAGNNPPANLTITPQTAKTSKDTDVTFSISATDSDENDTIRFIIGWDDDTEDLTTDFYNSSEVFDITHQWATYGVYTVSVTAEDSQNATTEATAMVYVDVYVIDDEINGWLIDSNSDGSYDIFKNTDTNQETDVQKQNESEYLIDADGDGTWDYIFDMDTETLREYKAEDSGESGLNIGLIVLVILIIVLILVFVYLSQKNKKEQKKKEQQKQKKEENKKQSKSKKQSSKKPKSKK